MRAYDVYAAEVLDASRKLRDRVRRNRLGAVWFGALFVGSVWLVLRLAEFAQTFGLPENLEITPSTLLFVAFFAALGKGAVDAYHRAVRPDSLVFLFSQPAPLRAVALGKFLTILWTNLAFLVAAMALAVLFVAGGMQIPLVPEFGLALVLAAVSGLASGFALTILGSQPSWRQKVVGLGAYAPVVGFLSIVLLDADATLTSALTAIAIGAVGAIVAVLVTPGLLLGAWNNQSSGRRRAGATRPYLPMKDKSLEALVDAELKEMVRKRQVALSVTTLGLLGAAVLGTFVVVGPPSGLPLRVANMFYPIILVVGVYVAVTTQLTVPGMAALGKELDRLWILKSHPVSGRTVWTAKSLALLLLVPAILAAVVLPLPIVAGFPVDVILLILAIGLSLAFALTALGIYLGGRRPNFDPNTGGLPDSIGMYNVFLGALVVAFFLAAFPGGVFQADRLVGLLLAGGFVVLGALSLRLAVRDAARRYDALQA